MMVRAAMQMQPVHPETLWWDNIIAEVSPDPIMAVSFIRGVCLPPTVSFIAGTLLRLRIVVCASRLAGDQLQQPAGQNQGGDLLSEVQEVNPRGDSHRDIARTDRE